MFPKCCGFAAEHRKIGDIFRSRIDESVRVFDNLLSTPHRQPVGRKAALKRARAAHFRQKRHIGDFRDWKDN